MVDDREVRPEVEPVVATDTLVDPQVYDSAPVPSDNLSPNTDQPSAESAPDGWMTITGLSKSVGSDISTVRKLIEDAGEEQPGLFSEYKDRSGKVSIHLHPSLVQTVQLRLGIRNPAPEGWSTINSLAKELGVTFRTVQRIAERTVGDDGTETSIYDDKSRRPATFYPPDAVSLIKQEIASRHVAAPEGWVTKRTLEDEFGVSHSFVSKTLEGLTSDSAASFREYIPAASHTPTVHYSPEIAKAFRELMGTRQIAPEGWATGYSIAKQLGVAHSTIARLTDDIRENNPGLVGTYRTRSGDYEHLSPEAQRLVRKHLAAIPEAPQGWLNASTIAKSLGRNGTGIIAVIDKLRVDHPELFTAETHGIYKGDKAKRPLEHFSPTVVNSLKEYLGDLQPAPEGWTTCNALAGTIGTTHRTVKKLIVSIREEHPKWIGTYTDEGGRVFEYISPEVATFVSNAYLNREAPPEGWQTSYAISETIGLAQRTVVNLAKTLLEEHPEWAQRFSDTTLQKRIFYSPEIIQAVTEKALPLMAARDQLKETQNLRKDIKEFLNDVDEGGSLEAQEFKELVSLFGAERAVDILYQYRPEYRKLPVPFVKSSLADYLGDFLVIKGGFNLASLEKGVAYLSDSGFRESLTEIIKSDCLRVLNQLGRNNLADINETAVIDYLNHIRQETAGFSTRHLEEVLDEIEAYYQLLFENIHKPSNFVDELEPGRQFPDINQRINVQEIAFKHKMLIADEMGTGKSASAIMAKEILGVNQALIVVPSNVIDVWENYLSDKVGEDGKQIGYFKPGQAPRVLIIDSLDILNDANPADYDYVIISQERLNEAYTEALSKFDYQMLIVDEMHKLKNLIDGKRADSLVKLAEKIQGDDKYLALLSGTPVPNKIGDVAMTLKLLYPERFEDIDNKKLVSLILNGDVLDLRSLLVPRMQMKSLTESVQMPRLKEEIHQVELTSEEQEIYSILVEEDELTAVDKLKILRQSILNPDFVDATPDIEGAKIRAVGQALEQTFATKDKVVMFVNGYIENVISGEATIFDRLRVPEDVQILTIHGAVDKQQRLRIQQQLQESDQKILLVVSGQTADVGVDFSAAQEVYFYNEPWTEYDKRQQLGRVYRPGLKDDLVSHVFITSGTIEEGMHRYIESKFRAVEKILRGIPISELEKEMLRQGEKQEDQSLEINADLAEYYFSSWDKMMKIYGYVKELGEEDFVKFLAKYDTVYAESYANLVGSRSYQANVSRLNGTLIDRFVHERGQKPSKTRILDIAAGPEMLKRHLPKQYAGSVVSLDINRHHFVESSGKRVVGSFVNLPLADKSIDYANLALGLHYTSYTPGRKNYERLEVLQELNRVLEIGGRGIITMIYTFDLQDDDNLRSVIEKLGFKVVESYTGEASSGRNFRSQVITLEKVKDCNPNTAQLAEDVGPEGLRSLKFKKRDTSLKDSRKIVTTYNFGDTTIQANLNEVDQTVLEEEERTLAEMKALEQKYGSVRAIPGDEIQASGLARIFNGKHYVLFKRLLSHNSAVVLRSF